MIYSDGISTHALREEGDIMPGDVAGKGTGFLPTPSARRATFTVYSHGLLVVFLPTPSARRAT